MRKIAFIGVGNMAGAIIGGMLRSGAVDHAHLILSDRFPEKCEVYVSKGAVMAATPAEAAAQADCVVLSVKPHAAPSGTLDMATLSKSQQYALVISVSSAPSAT